MVGGFVAGFISAIPGPNFATWGTLGKVLSYGASFLIGGAGTLAGGLITGSVNSVETGLLAFLIGGIANIAARGISEKIADMKASRIFNQGNKAKSLEVQQLQGHPLNMGSQALKGNMRNVLSKHHNRKLRNY